MPTPTKPSPLERPLPPSLATALQAIYQPAGLLLTRAPKRESENHDYEGYTFRLGGHEITFRQGKVTPGRPGNFVALYDRIGRTIVPIDAEARPLDFLVVAVADRGEERRGHFVFPRKLLIEQGIISEGLAPSARVQRKQGKLSFRVFPPWVASQPSAHKGEAWQRPCFFAIPQAPPVDLARVRELFSLP